MGLTATSTYIHISGKKIRTIMKNIFKVEESLVTLPTGFWRHSNVTWNRVLQLTMMMVNCIFCWRIETSNRRHDSPILFFVLTSFSTLTKASPFHRRGESVGEISNHYLQITLQQRRSWDDKYPNDSKLSKSQDPVITVTQFIVWWQHPVAVGRSEGEW